METQFVEFNWHMLWPIPPKSLRKVWLFEIFEQFILFFNHRADVVSLRCSLICHKLYHYRETVHVPCSQKYACKQPEEFSCQLGSTTFEMQFGAT